MDDPKYVVALVDRIDYDPDRVNIEDLVEGPAKDIHLSVYPVDALYPALDIGVGVLGLDPVIDALLDVVEEVITLSSLEKLIFNFFIPIDRGISARYPQALP